MALEKIKIEPGHVVNIEFKKIDEPIEAMYNPKEFTIETRNQFQITAIPGLPTPITQFVSGEAQKLSLDLFFDSYEKKDDVRKLTGKVLKLIKIDKKLHAPPICKFTWGGKPIAGDTPGEKNEFLGVIDSITQKFTMFHESGIPVRATLTLSISEYQTIQQQLEELDLQSADHTKHIIFKQGDSLWLLANEEYGDSSYWRTIANANNIDNPRHIKPGTELNFPPLE